MRCSPRIALAADSMGTVWAPRLPGDKQSGVSDRAEVAKWAYAGESFRDVGHLLHATGYSGVAAVQDCDAQNEVLRYSVALQCHLLSVVRLNRSDLAARFSPTR